ncbi:MAG: BLUF domain-containing protein [Gemmobacter sp.]
MRLMDTMSYRKPCPNDFWDTISDWLTENGIEVTEQVLSQVRPEVDTQPGCTKFARPTNQGTQMNLTRLIYTSTRLSQDAETVARILTTSRANNVRDGITGALIVHENCYLQLLEGDRAAVARCLMRITQDRRHKHVTVISCADAAQRLFLEGSMHRIDTSRIKAEILSRYKVNGVFNPAHMTQFATEDLCRTLSGGNWQAEAA